MGVSFIFPQFLWLALLTPFMVFLALFGRRKANQLRQWAEIALRVILLTCVILALAGLQLHLPSKTLTVIFLLDVSDSISPAEQSRGEVFIRQALESMRSGDRAGIVVFGEDALVERLSSETRNLSSITSVPVTTRTDIASALQLGMALFPDEGARRIVLLSDGRENVGVAVKQAELAGLQKIELQYIALGEDQFQTEVQVNEIDTPSVVREGQDFDLGITIESTAAVGATLRVYAEDTLVHAQNVHLQSGINRYKVTINKPEAGFRRFRAQIVPDADNRLQNNEASAYTVVYGPPAILIVEGTPGEAENLSRALESANMKVTLIPPSQTPTTLPELARYETIILVDVPALSLPVGSMDALPTYVKELGKGLLMVGGEHGFGAGGYLRTPLETAMPVYMDVKSRELAANLALIVTVDKSGSMGRCHCDNPDLNQSYTAVETGQAKVDIAKEAIMRSSSALSDQDYLGVLAFDEKAQWALKPQKLPSQYAIENSIGPVQAAGQTNIYNGVYEAYQAIENIDAKRKHVILLTDGWEQTGDLLPIAKEMRDSGVTLSVIAAGGGSAEYLKSLAEAGGGRYYSAENMLSVPDIFLKETIQSIGQYVIEEPFYPLPASPSPVLRGINASQLPGLFGYNGTSPKSTARLDLLTPRGDPLLASWQYGLGRAAAWTSDLKGQWAAEWVQWGDFSRFTSQLVGWLLPAPQVEGFDAHAAINDNGIQIQLSASDDKKQPFNFLDVQAKIIDPDLKTIETKLVQVGPGKYEVASPANQPGAYLVWLGITNQDEPVGQLTMGVVVPFSPEYRIGGSNLGLLSQLAQITGGAPLAEPDRVFIHNLPAAARSLEIWHPLLLIVALLFPIDIALRRLTVTKRDIEAGRLWLRKWMRKWFKKAPQSAANIRPEIFGSLFLARNRARSSQQPSHPLQEKGFQVDRDAEQGALKQNGEQTAPLPDQAFPESPVISEEQNPSQQDTLLRLKEAKKRANKNDP